MAGNYMGNMTFGVNFKVDTKALDQLDTQFTNMLAGITNFTRTANRSGENILKQQALDAKKAYDQLYDAMSRAYNSKLGQFDLSKVNANLREAGTSLNTVVNQLNSAGQNVNTILSSFMGNKLMIKETNQFLDKMAVTFGNTVRWSLTTKMLNTITGAVQKAFYFTKDLDRSLNDIRIVTGKSADEMERFAQQATNAAQALGKTTTDYTKASLLFYQQGLGDKEVAARTSTTLKASNVTGQSTSEVSEQLTAIWNGYKVSAAETEKYIDKVAAVAASTASNLEELSTGMSKVASAANMMGVDIDQLNAQLSTVISVTRQAPETIGAAFKTVYSRMSTIKAGGIDEEDGTTLTSYTEKMNNFGISVLDSNGKLRDMGEVIEEIGNKWETFSREAQVGLAQAMGGTRQYSNLTALFENWDKYQAALKTSQGATGTLEKQQEIYMDSLEAHFKQLTAEAEKFYESILDEDAIKAITDGLKQILETLNNFVKGIGGAGAALATFGATVFNLFSNKLGSAIGQFQTNFIIGKEQQASVNAVSQLTKDIKEGNIAGSTVISGPVTAKDVGNSIQDNQVVMSNNVLKEQASIQQDLLKVSQQLGTQAYNQLTIENEKAASLKALYESYKAIEDEITKTSEKQLSADEVAERLNKSNIETEAKEIQILIERLQKTEELLNKNKKLTEEQRKQMEQLREGSQKSFKYRQDLANSSVQNAKDRIQQVENTQQQITNFKSTGKNLTEGLAPQASIRVTNRTNKDYQQQLQTMQQILLVKSKTVALSNNEQIALKTINKILTHNQATVTQIDSINKNLNQTEKDLNTKLEEEKNLLKQAEEHAKGLADAQAKMQKEAEQTAAKLAKGKNEKQLQKEKDAIEAELAIRQDEHSKNLDAEKYRDYKPILDQGAGGEADRAKNESAGIEANIRAAERAAAAQQKWSTMIRRTSGAVRAGTEFVGGLTVALDQSKTALERTNGSWAAMTGTISGGLAMVNPMLGMLASGVFGLAKTVLDATGITEEFAKVFDTNADKVQRFRDEFQNANKELKEATQTINEYNAQTREFHSNLRSLEDMKESWDKINAKMQSHLSLTSEEEEAYQSMATQILELNDSITYEYDEQHNLILKNNEALTETINILKEQRALQEQTEKRKILDNAQEKLNKAKTAKENYETAQADLRTNQNAIDLTKENFNLISGYLKSGNINNINVTSGADYLSDEGKSYLTEALKTFDGTEKGYLKFMEKLANDNDKDYQNSIKELLEEISSEATESDKWDEDIWGELANFLSFGIYGSAQLVGFSQADDLPDLFKELMEYDLPSLGQLITDTKDATVTQYDDITKEYINAMKQLFNTDFAIDMDSTGSKEIDKIVAKKAEEAFANMMTNADENVDYEAVKKEIIKNSQKYAATLKEQSKTIEEVSESVGNINLNKTNQSINEYVSAIEEQRQKLVNEGITDENVLNTVFGKGNYGKDLINKVYGITDYEDISQKFAEKTGFDINEIYNSYSMNDLNNILEFMKTVVGDPEEYKKYKQYGDDFVNQYEGFLHDKFQTKIFKDYLEEINGDLKTLKQSALSGDELDDEVFEKLNDQLYKYRNHLREVSTEREILADKDLYGTQVWYESLQRVEQKLHKIQEKTLLDERKDLIVEVKADTKLAKEELDDLLNQDYKIIAGIEFQHTNTYETAVKEIENLQTALSYVGEEGEVAADNVLGLLNAFPELNDMITKLNDDGSISLTKEQIELIKQRTQVDIDGIVATREMELQTQLNRALAEQELTEKQIKLTEDELKDFANKQHDKEKFAKAFTDLYGKYSDAQVQITESNNDIINTDTWDTADAITNYWVDAYANADNAYKQFVNDVIEGNKAMAGEANNFNASSTITNTGIREQKLNGSSSTLTQDILDRAKNTQTDEDFEKMLNESLVALKSKYQMTTNQVESIKNEMLSLTAISLKSVDAADKLGKSTKEAEKQGKDLYDVYHNINKELDFINQKVTILQKKQKLFKDNSLLKNLQAQTKEYNNQIQALNKKLAIQRGYDEELKTRQTNALGDKGLAAYGVKFDKNGNITNYEEIAKKLQASQTSDEAVKNYENFINEVKVYEENHKLALELEGQLYDAIAKRHELMSQEVQVKIDMILDTSKAEEQLYEFAQKYSSFNTKLIINPDQTSVDAAIAKESVNLVNEKINALPQLTNTLEEYSDIEQVLGTRAIRNGEIAEQLEKYQEGGNVNLLLRPTIDTEDLNKQGYDAGKGFATVFSTTFSNKAGDVAVNFTPIIVDPITGEYKGVMDSKEFENYCSEVINGVREDDLNLQIGAEFTGENAIQEAVNAGEKIHELHEEYEANKEEYKGYSIIDLDQIKEDGTKIVEQIEQTAEDIQQAYQGTLDAYSNALKELSDWDKRVLAKYDMINGVYDHAEKLTKLWYGEDSLEARTLLTNSARERNDYLEKEAKQANKQVARNWKEYEDAVATGNAKLASEAYDIWAESINNLQKLTEQYAEQRQKQLMDELALAEKINETQIYGGRSRDEVMNSWELINKQADIYLDTINAQFKVTQLENKYLQAINNSIGNSKAQEKINKIMNEEMKMLREKDKLSKYDIERAEAKYDLTLKQIALEEARENKTNLRLRRDSQGNYTYQYTANQDEILKAQNDLNIAKNNLYNIDRNRLQDLTQQAFDTESEYVQKLSDIREKYKDDEAARLTAEDELYTRYFGADGILTGILDEWKNANINLGESIDESLNGSGKGTVLGSFEELKKNLPEEISTLSSALDPSIYTIIDKWTNKETGVASAYETLKTDTKTFYEEYKKDISTFAKEIDQDQSLGKVRLAFKNTKEKIDEFRKAAELSTTAIGNLNNKNSEFSLSNLISDFEELGSALGNDDEDSEGLISKIKAANKSLKRLVKPDTKVSNLKKIKKALKTLKTQLEANDGAFKSSETVVSKYLSTIEAQADKAAEAARGVAEAINQIPTEKSTTITTIHIDKYQTSGNDKGSGTKTKNTIDLGTPDKTADEKGNRVFGFNDNGTIKTVFGFNDNGTIKTVSDTLSDEEASNYKQHGNDKIINTKNDKGFFYITKTGDLSDLMSYNDAFEAVKGDLTKIGHKDIKSVKLIVDGLEYLKMFTYDEAKKEAQRYLDKGYNNANFQFFNTGGYTGVWGEQGKLAVLHEKELVLNKEDTENMLSIVKTIRQIDIQKLQTNLLDNLFNIQHKLEHASDIKAQPAEEVNQNITINAEFPDAKDRDEIKAAFDSLVNLASQRAYTKKY